MSMSVSWHGDKVKRQARAGVVRGLFLGAEHVLEESNRLVPIEENILEGSGGTDVDESALRASVYYDTPYAARQHEEMTWRHNAGRSAKYLEIPLNTERKTVLKIIARETKSKIGS